MSSHKLISLSPILLILLTLSGINAQTTAQAGDIVINEFLAAPSGGQNEWVEIYNKTNQPLTIGGFYVDDVAGSGGSPKQIPSGTTIDANGFFVFEFTNFLNNGGDDVRLLSSDQSTVLDEYTYTTTKSDKSICRRPDGEEWSDNHWQPTKGAYNLPPCESTVYTTGNLEIHVINVGQGQAQLIIGPTGRTLLFDCPEIMPKWSSNETATLVANEICRILGKRHINYFVASHWHLDHIGYPTKGGIWSLLEQQNVTVDTIIDRDGAVWNDANNDGVFDTTEIEWRNAGTYSGTAKNWIQYFSDPNSYIYNKRVLAQLGSTSQIDIGIAQGVTVKVVQVDANGVMQADGTTPVPGDHTTDEIPPSENDYSITIWVKWGKFDFVSGGDTDGEYDISCYGENCYSYNDVESVIADRINQKIDVVAANHHGSGHSSNHKYVTTLHPQVAVYNVGHNSYGHPVQKVLDLYDSIGSDQYLTAMGDPDRDYSGTTIIDGNIEIKVTSSGSKFTVNGNAYNSDEPSSGPIIPPVKGLVINECLPRPGKRYKYEFIELYNKSKDTINISGMILNCALLGRTSLTTIPIRIKTPTLKIPNNTIILPNGFYVINNLKSFLNDKGSPINLLSKDGKKIYDSVKYSRPRADLSFGRLPDGSLWQKPRQQPTPGSKNQK